MMATQKLIDTLTKYGTLIEGSIQERNGKKYRYDLIESNIKNTPYWMQLIFDSAAKENGAEYQTQFSINGMSFHFERSNFKSKPNGKISYKRLVIL